MAAHSFRNTFETWKIKKHRNEKTDERMDGRTKLMICLVFSVENFVIFVVRMLKIENLLTEEGTKNVFEEIPLKVCYSLLPLLPAT